MRVRFFSKVLLPILFLVLAGNFARAAAVVELEVDATELPRKLLHTRMTFPGEIARTNFWYPKWIPGIHAPRGPIENMAGGENGWSFEFAYWSKLQLTAGTGMIDVERSRAGWEFCFGTAIEQTWQ